MESVKGKVPHALIVVYLKTILNGWTCDRRMRTLNCLTRPIRTTCLLCLCKCDDSLEHIAVCDTTKSVFSKFNITIHDMHDFLALNDGCTNPKVMVKHLFALGIVYSIYNTLKHHDDDLPPLHIPALITAGISSAAGAH